MGLVLCSGSHCVFELGVHIVFCTKYRKPVLGGGVGVVCKRVLGECCRAFGWRVVSIDVMPDHVHLFVQYSPSESVSDIVRVLKSVSAVRLFSEFPELKRQKFWGSGLWSRGFYAGSVGDMSSVVIEKYISNQAIKAAKTKEPKI